MEDRKSIKKKIVEATPIVSLIIYLLLGFCFEIWHPSWLVFLLIPIMPFIVGFKKIKISFGLLICIIYFAVGIIWNLWHPTWIIFLTIPIYHIFVDK